jgi:hypothetical protein
MAVRKTSRLVRQVLHMVLFRAASPNLQGRNMNKKEQAAIALENKIESAIERGEFTPDYRYLRNTTFRASTHKKVFMGPCGCAIAAAAHVSGLRGEHIDSAIIQFLIKHTNLTHNDVNCIEAGYEDYSEPAHGYDPNSPYFRLGIRLKRFKPS